MERYIGANALKEDLIHNRGFYPAIVKRAIENAPTADVTEVRHGVWQVTDSDIGYVEMACSLCGCKHVFYTDQGYNYCSKCGAKMDGKRKEQNEE